MVLAYYKLNTSGRIKKLIAILLANYSFIHEDYKLINLIFLL